MNDTHPEIAKLFHSLLMKRSPEERVEMCFSMFASVKEMIRSNVRNPMKWREETFLRLYGNDFDEKTQKKILKAL